MAEFRTYKCKKCGSSVQTEPAGFYGLMSGMYYNFKCKKCKRLVTLSSKAIVEMGNQPRCPICEESQFFSTWNPIEGRCPKCDGEMEVDHSEGIIMAD